MVNNESKTHLVIKGKTDSEVAQLNVPAVAVHEDVGRLNVPMQQLLLTVEVLEGKRHSLTNLWGQDTRNRVLGVMAQWMIGFMAQWMIGAMAQFMDELFGVTTQVMSYTGSQNNR